MEQWTIWFIKNGRVNLFYNKHVYSCIRTIFTFVHTCIYLKDEEGNETGSEVKEDKSGTKYYTTVKSYLYPRGFMLCTLTRFFWQDVFIYKTVAFLKNHFFFYRFQTRKNIGYSETDQNVIGKFGRLDDRKV